MRLQTSPARRKFLAGSDSASLNRLFAIFEFQYSFSRILRYSRTQSKSGFKTSDDKNSQQSGTYLSGNRAFIYCYSRNRFCSHIFGADFTNVIRSRIDRTLRHTFSRCRPDPVAANAFSAIIPHLFGQTSTPQKTWADLSFSGALCAVVSLRNREVKFRSYSSGSSFFRPGGRRTSGHPLFFAHSRRELSVFSGLLYLGDS